MSDLLREFGLVDRSELKKIDVILGKLETWEEDLELIKDRLKEQLRDSKSLTARDVQAFTQMIKTLANLIELYGKYTGDLKNHNVNMNINMDYKEALQMYMGIFNEVAEPSVKVKFLEKAKEKGIVYLRD